MTSSLVGSEMCIRDRWALRWGIRLDGATTCRRTRVRRRFTSGRRSSSTVSYTHLTLPTICSV
eukprot:1542652-Prorocentrum_lima.AAC.1